MVPQSQMCVSAVLISRGRPCRVRDLQLDSRKKVVNYEKYMSLTYFVACCHRRCRNSGTQIYSSVLVQFLLKLQDSPLRRETDFCQLEAAILGEAEAAGNP